MFQYINIGQVFKSQINILNKCPENKWVFIYIPIIVGIIATILFNKNTASILDALTLFISIFIPLFANMLSILISFAMNKLKTRHNKERIPLIKETFHSICYLIPLALALIVLVLFMHLTIFDENTFEIAIKSFKQTISIYNIYHSIISLIFYGLFTHLLMIILMITKRVYKLINTEITLLTETDDC